jgi:hypothetical protein
MTMSEVISAEFPEWEITASAPGTWSAFWRSNDGRTRRYLVARSSTELLALLRDRGVTTGA